VFANAPRKENVFCSISKIYNLEFILAIHINYIARALVSTQGRILVIKPRYHCTLILSLPQPRIPDGVSWVPNTPTAGTENGQFQSDREADEAN
jgi:hypothetical protein